MQMQVTVPAGSKGGDAIQVQTPDGRPMMVTVPDGLTEGQAFVVNAPAAPVVAAMAVPVAAMAVPVGGMGIEQHLADMAAGQVMAGPVVMPVHAMVPGADDPEFYRLMGETGHWKMPAPVSVGPVSIMMEVFKDSTHNASMSVKIVVCCCCKVDQPHTITWAPDYKTSTTNGPRGALHQNVLTEVDLDNRRVMYNTTIMNPGQPPQTGTTLLDGRAKTIVMTSSATPKAFVMERVN